MAAIPGSIPVTGSIAPTDTGDTYFTHDEIYGKGGYRSVADLTARDAITTDRRKEGMLVNVLSNSTVYKLVGGIANTDWEAFSTGGGGSITIDEVPTDGSDNAVSSNGVFEALALKASTAELEVVNQKFEDMNEPTGFLREFPDTMGIIELCPDGTTVYSIDGNGTLTTRTDGQFATGTPFATPANAREFAIYPNGASYKIYIAGTLKVITALQRVSFANQSGLQYVYHQGDGTLGVGTTFSFEYFEDTPITAVTYGNANTQELIVFGDERHGVGFPGWVHRVWHFTFGTRYISGMFIEGMTGGGTTYTNITSGTAYDEDIYMQIPSQTNAPFLYIDGTVWNIQLNGTDVAYRVGGIAQYNRNTAGNYSLANVTGNDCMIMFFVLTNNKLYPYIKMLGQKAYTDANAARADIANALNTLVLAGLPSPEFLAIGAIIVNASGRVQLLSDGSTYYDLRESKITGSGTVSTPSTYHQDLLDLQGGLSTPIEYYHLSSAQYNDLTDGNEATVHHHDSKYTAKNTAITGSTKTKITYDSKGLVTAGANLVEADIPTLSQAKITNLTTDLAGKAATNQTMYIGTTATPINRTSGAQTLTGTSIGGNAASATILQIARTINGVSFNGSANITIEDATKILLTEKGTAGGVATLGGDGKVPSAQLPSYVDDVLEYANLAAFPVIGETGKIYVALDSNLTYRWSGTVYIEISSGGGTAGVTSVNGRSGAVTLGKTDVGLSNVENTADASKNVLSATKLTTARTVSATGDATGSLSFDGSANASMALTLANSGAVAGTYPKVTVDAKGRVTSGASLVEADLPTVTIAAPASSATQTTAGTRSIGAQLKTLIDNIANLFTNKLDKNANITAGTATKITYDAKGLVTAGTTLAATDIPNLDASKITTGTLTVGTSGNAGTATKLATPRAINGVNFDGSANISVIPTGGGTGSVLTKNSATSNDYSWKVPSSPIFSFKETTVDISTGDNVNMQDIAELTFDLDANSMYRVMGFMTFQSSTTAGYSFGAGLPTDSIPHLMYTATTSTTTTASIPHAVIPNGGPIVNILVTAGSVTTANTNVTATFHGFIRTILAGQFVARYKSGNAGTIITLKKDSVIIFERIQ